MSYSQSLAKDRDRALRALAAMRNEFRTVLTEIDNIVLTPRISDRVRVNQIDRVAKAARSRIEADAEAIIAKAEGKVS